MNTYLLRAVLLMAMFATSACAATRGLALVSDDYGVCITGIDGLVIDRYNVIDVEKVAVNVRGRKVVEFVFDEAGVGVYKDLIHDADLKGHMFRGDSGILVYAQLSQSDGWLFVAKSIRAGREPVWVYAKFFDQSFYEAAPYAIDIMKSMTDCEARDGRNIR